MEPVFNKIEIVKNTINIKYLDDVLIEIRKIGNEIISYIRFCEELWSGGKVFLFFNLKK